MTRHQELKSRLVRLSGMKKEGMQAALARSLRSSKATVSDWWTGKRWPSAEAFFKMAMASKDAADKVWFLNQAGLRPGHMRDVLQLLEIQEEPTKFVRPLDEGPEGLKIPVAASLLPNPGKCAYFVLTKDCNNSPFHEGQYVIVDFEKRDGKKVWPYWDQIVLVRIEPYEKRGGPFLSDGYRIGELVYEPAPTRDFVGGAPLLCDINRYGQGLRLRENWWRVDELATTIAQTAEAHARLKREMETESYIEIMGRVVAWFPDAPGTRGGNR